MANREWRMASPPVAMATSAIAACLLATPAGAHGFGQRYELPVPLPLYLFGAAAAVALSFAVFGLFVRRTLVAQAGKRYDLLVTPLGRVVAHPAILLALRAAVLGFFMARSLIGAEVAAERARWGVEPRYNAVVERGRLHRLEAGGAGRVPFGQIEAFWSYLQRHLRAKGGIRATSLPLYLSEFVWRYNHRKQTASEQAQDLLRLLGESTRWNGRDHPSSRKTSAHHDLSSHVSP